jgi:hypothetical protein
MPRNNQASQWFRNTVLRNSCFKPSDVVSRLYNANAWVSLRLDSQLRLNFKRSWSRTRTLFLKPDDDDKVGSRKEAYVES